MLNRQYHIHVACSQNMAAELHDSLVLFFEKKAFLTFDLLTNKQQALAYSHRCIERCDYVLIVIEDSYGECNSAGVSQLHLSYSYARTKKKPMQVLVKAQASVQSCLNQKRADFIKVIEQQVPQLYYFNSQLEMSRQLAEAFAELTNNHARLGWVRGIEAADTTKMAVTPLKQNPLVNTVNNMSSIDTTTYAFKTNEPTETIRFELEATPIDPKYPAADNLLKSNIGAIDDMSLDDVSLDDTITLNYSAHAYEEGNLSEVNMTLDVRWDAILRPLINLSMPFSDYGLQRCLNDLAAGSANRDIKLKRPRVHAISRCQVSSLDIKRVQQTLEHMGWIRRIPTSYLQSRRLWQVNDDIALTLTAAQD